MRKLPLPSIRVRGVLALCTSTIADPALKARFEAIGPDLEAGETYYERLARSGELYKFLPSPAVGVVSRAEMEWVYTNKLSRRADNARTVYNQLKASSLRCPFCAQRDVSTLDHYLAKTVHAYFTVTPMNLVPACKDCNKAKGSRNASTPSEQVLHPYFDDVDTDLWLAATLSASTPPSLTYFPAPPTTWPSVQRERLAKHFEVFGLGALYAVNAASEMAGIGHYLNDLADKGGAEEVRRYLAERSRSWERIEKNSWQTALYRVMAASDWFWQGGHRTINN